MGKVQKEQDKQMICSAAGVTPRCWNPKSLMLESQEIEGARKILLKLQSDWDMSLIPAVKCKCKQERETDASYGHFPIAPKYRKVVGKGMMRFLLSDKDNIRRYLFDDCELGFNVKHDKKGKPIDCEVFIIKNDKTKEQ